MDLGDDIVELENYEIDQPDTKRPVKVKDLGELHNLLIRGLPDWIDGDGILRTYDLAQFLGVSYQALYKIYRRNRIPPKRIMALVKLSGESKNRPEGFEPLTTDDFLEFLG